MPAFGKSGKGEGKKVPAPPMGEGGGYGSNTQFRLGGDQGGVKGMGSTSNGEKKVPGPDIKGRHLT